MKIDSDVSILRPVRLEGLLKADVAFVHTAKLPADGPGCDRSALSVAERYCRNTWLNPHTVYYGNFVIGWLGLFTSPEALAFSMYHWRNGWEHPWTDQTFWHYALLATRATHLVHDASFLRRDGFFQHRRDAFT